MKISPGVVKFQFRVLRISRERATLFGIFALAAVFMVLLWFGGLTVWRNQRLLTNPPEIKPGPRTEFREDRLEKALEIINAREK